MKQPLDSSQLGAPAEQATQRLRAHLDGVVTCLGERYVQRLDTRSSYPSEQARTRKGTGSSGSIRHVFPAPSPTQNIWPWSALCHGTQQVPDGRTPAIAAGPMESVEGRPWRWSRNRRIRNRVHQLALLRVLSDLLLKRKRGVVYLQIDRYTYNPVHNTKDTPCSSSPT